MRGDEPRSPTLMPTYRVPHMRGDEPGSAGRSDEDLESSPHAWG